MSECLSCKFNKPHPFNFRGCVGCRVRYLLTNDSLVVRRSWINTWAKQYGERQAEELKQKFAGAWKAKGDSKAA